jgi:antitoxin component YwqK of YwqJK toxin-antitoxin module
MVHLAFLLLLATSISAQDPYTCGQKKMVKRPYGTVELRVDCEYKTKNILSAFEYKGNVQHGFQIDYDSLWRKRDSSFFVNGRENGLCLFWDTLGNVIGRETYRNGMYVGRREAYWSPDHPSLIKNYNASGKEEGSWEAWWKNGNKKSEFLAKNGTIVSGTEYYQNGKPRARYVTKYEPKNKNVFKKKYVQAEAWAPNGKSVGKIVNGNGEWILFPDGKDSTDHTVFREVYKDSLMVKGDKLDSAEIAKWLKP